MPSRSIWQRRAGHLGGALAILFLLADAAAKLLVLPAAVEGTIELGYPEGLVLVIGIIELVCVAAYALPWTAVLGAVLLTGYLGGAVATHVRCGSPLLTHVLFPIYLALLVWGALFLRDARLGTLLPLRSPAASPKPRKETQRCDS